MKQVFFPLRKVAISVASSFDDRVIYLDSNATAPTDPQVVAAMQPFLVDCFANPSSGYRAGRQARLAVDFARGQLAALLKADAKDVMFTSGGTESNNAAIESAMMFWPQRKHLVIGATEHPAVSEPAQRWLRRGGELTVVPVNRFGVVDLEALRRAIRADTALVSIMWANNETGVLAPMPEIVEIAHAAGALVHADAVQAVGKVMVDVQAVPVDFLSLSAHKMHGPKGVGALYASPRARFQPLLIGGGQESGRRSGTENVPGFVGLGQAAELMQQDHSPVRELRDAFELKVRHATGAVLNGHPQRRLGNTSSLCFEGIDSAGLLILLDERDVACSAGSACHAGSLHPSIVLEAMGFDARHAASTLRFSFSRFNTLPEVLQAADLVIEAVAKMREFSAGGPGVDELALCQGANVSGADSEAPPLTPSPLPGGEGEHGDVIGKSMEKQVMDTGARV